jgi:hypothetical protein
VKDKNKKYQFLITNCAYFFLYPFLIYLIVINPFFAFLFAAFSIFDFLTRWFTGKNFLFNIFKIDLVSIEPRSVTLSRNRSGCEK